MKTTLSVRNNHGSALMVALVVTMIIGLLASSIGTYMSTSSDASVRARDFEAYNALGRTIAAHAADSRLCAQTMNFVGGWDASDAMSAEGLRLQVSGALGVWREMRAAGDNRFPPPGQANTPRLIPDYASNEDNEFAVGSVGPGRLRIEEIRFANATLKSSFGNSLEYEGDLVIQATPMNVGMTERRPERAMARKTVSKFYVVYNTTEAVIESCNADVSAELYCTDMGGSFVDSPASGQPGCIFLTDDFDCGPNKYIRDFDANGAPICADLNIVPCPAGFYAYGIHQNSYMECKELPACPSGYFRSGNYCVAGGTPAPTGSGVCVPTGSEYMVHDFDGVGVLFSQECNEANYKAPSVGGTGMIASYGNCSTQQSGGASICVSGVTFFGPNPYTRCEIMAYSCGGATPTPSPSPTVAGCTCSPTTRTANSQLWTSCQYGPGVDGSGNPVCEAYAWQAITPPLTTCDIIGSNPDPGNYQWPCDTPPSPTPTATPTAPPGENCTNGLSGYNGSEGWSQQGNWSANPSIVDLGTPANARVETCWDNLRASLNNHTMGGSGMHSETWVSPGAGNCNRVYQDFTLGWATGNFINSKCSYATHGDWALHGGEMASGGYWQISYRCICPPPPTATPTPTASPTPVVWTSANWPASNFCGNIGADCSPSNSFLRGPDDLSYCWCGGVGAPGWGDPMANQFATHHPYCNSSGKVELGSYVWTLNGGNCW